MDGSRSTILITGSGGFIGKALQSHGHHGCSHDELLRGTPLPEPIQTIVHAGRDPLIGTSNYRLEDDREIEIARIAREHRLKYIMLSSRKVYGAQPSPIHEDAPCEPIDDYGSQKLGMERRLIGLLGERLTILRLSNVFGYEPGRKTFMGMMLDGLASRVKSVQYEPTDRKGFHTCRYCSQCYFDHRQKTSWRGAEYRVRIASVDGRSCRCSHCRFWEGKPKDD